MAARRALLALLVLSVSGFGTAGAAPPAPDAPDEMLRRLSNAQFTVEGDPAGRPSVVPARLALHRALDDMVAGEDGFDLRTLGRLARAAIRTYGGAEVGDPAVAAQADQPVHLGARAGDLDGDGLADVLDYQPAEPGTPIVLSVRSGLTGAELWSLPLTGIDAIVQTLQGSDGDDLAILELHMADGSPGEGCLPFDTCLGVQGATYRWTLTVFDGASGAERFTRSWDGVLGALYGYSFGAAYTFGQAVLATNAFLAVLPSDDHDGDGVQDFVIDEVDLLGVDSSAGTFNDEVAAFAFATSVITATRASVVSADDGATMFARVAAGPGLSALFPGVDGVGDDTTDLLWDSISYLGATGGCAFGSIVPDGEQCWSFESGSRSLDLIDGSTMVTAWTRDISDAGFILPAGGDLDGDGAEDVVQWVFGQTLSTVLLSGATGDELWRAPDILMGSVGDGIGLAVTIAFDDSNVLYELNRRDGATGDLLFSTQHSAELPTDSFDIFVFAEFSLIPDADGDGKPDAFAQVTIFANSVTVSSIVERGAVNEVLFARDIDHERFVLPVPDASGDGLADLLDVNIEFHRRSTAFDFAGIELPTADVAWERTITIVRDAEFYLDLNADTDGAGGSDYIMSIIQRTDEGSIESALEVTAGSTGQPIWVLGGPLTPAPPVATGGIAGTLTGDGAEFFGACIGVTTPAGEDVAFDLASPDGSYVIDELDDGSYIVRFGDCFMGAFAEEWYDDASSFEEATPVVVSSGAITAGIDGDLAAL